MFGQIETNNLPNTVKSYETAVQHFESVRPWRGADSPWDWMPMGNDKPMRKRHMGVRRTLNGDIEYQLYNTVVITWHKGNTVTLDLSYDTRSTYAFANAFLPPDAGCLSDRLVYNWRWQENEVDIRRVPDVVTLRNCRGKWIPAAGTPCVPFRRIALDRSRTHAVLKRTNYHQFCNWLTAFRALSERKTTGGGYPFNAPHYSDLDMADMLDDRGEWPAYATDSLWVTAESIKQKLRHAIYAEAGSKVYRVQYKDVVTSWAECRQYLLSEDKYGRYISD